MSVTVICLIALVIWMGVGAIWMMGLLLTSSTRWYDYVACAPILVFLAVSVYLEDLRNRLFSRE